MNNQEKIKLLNKLIDKSDKVTVESSSDPNFKSWKNLVERTFIKVFGKDSTEFEHFNNLRFFFPAMVYTSGSDYTADHLKAFRRDYKMLMESINEYIDEFKEDIEPLENQEEITDSPSNVSKIFISHASQDANIVEELIEVLESIGVESNQIFCTSFEGYGIGLGENFLESIKSELSSDSLVLFVLSENFYKSPVCMCEMGATWVLSKEHIPIIIPPLDYKDIQGVIPLTQGLKINDSLKLNSLKTKIEELLCINNPVSFSTWERKRDRILGRVNKLVRL